MNGLLAAIGAGVVIGITVGILLCIVRGFFEKTKADTKRQSFYELFSDMVYRNIDPETIKLFVKCTGSENSELYTKIVYEVVQEINPLSKDDGEKRVLEHEIAYLSLKTDCLAFNAYRNVWEKKHNCKYVSILERLMNMNKGKGK